MADTQPLEWIVYAREDTGADLPGNGRYFSLRPGVPIKVVPDTDTSDHNAIGISFANRLVAMAVCKPFVEPNSASLSNVAQEVVKPQVEAPVVTEGHPEAEDSNDPESVINYDSNDAVIESNPPVPPVIDAS